MNKTIIINRLNSLCMLLVIMLHCVIHIDSYEGEFIYLFIYNGLSRIAVPVFFIISSYLFFINYSFSKIAKRTKTVLLPFLLWSIISYFIFVVFPTIPLFSVFFNNRTELSLSSFLISTFISPKNGALWFLRDLYILVILSPIIFYICKRHLLSIVLFCFLFIVWIFDFNYSFFIESSLFYFVGAFISINKISLTRSNLYSIVKKYTFIFLAILLLSCILLPFITLHYKLNPMYITKIIVMLGCMTIWGSLDFFNQNNNVLYALDAFKKYSFFCFASHLIFAQFIRKILLRCFSMDSFFSIIFVYILLVGLVVCICCLLQKLLSKYTYNTLRILTGGRC